MQFVSNVLPSLLGELLAELRVSTGPGLRTTALILSTYSRTQGANVSVCRELGCYPYCV